MFSWWGDRVVRWRWGVLAAGSAFVVFAALWGTSVFGSLVSGGFDNPKSESAIAANLVSTKLDRNTADIVILVRNPDLTVDSPVYRSAVAQIEANVPRNNVRSVASYWTIRSIRARPGDYARARRHQLVGTCTVTPPLLPSIRVAGVRTGDCRSRSRVHRRRAPLSSRSSARDGADSISMG
jgi:hypothetical protein